MKYDSFDLKSYDNVVKPHLRKIQKAFGKKKKLMILDEVCSGSSLDYILRNNAQELSEVADKIYVSAIASNDKSSQSWRLEKHDYSKIAEKLREFNPSS